MKKFLSLCAIGLLAVSSYGCVVLAGAAAGAGAYAYISGDLEKNIDRSVDQVHNATLKAADKLQMIVLSDKTDSHESVIKAQFNDGKEATIKIEALTEKASKIRIRAGVFGDEEKSLSVLNMINKYL